MSKPSSFLSPSYCVIRQKLRLNPYSSEAKVSEFNEIVEEAATEIAKEQKCKIASD